MPPPFPVIPESPFNVYQTTWLQKSLCIKSVELLELLYSFSSSRRIEVLLTSNAAIHEDKDGEGPPSECQSFMSDIQGLSSSHLGAEPRGRVFQDHRDVQGTEAPRTPLPALAVQKPLPLHHQVEEAEKDLCKLFHSL